MVIGYISRGVTMTRRERSPRLLWCRLALCCAAAGLPASGCSTFGEGAAQGGSASLGVGSPPGQSLGTPAPELFAPTPPPHGMDPQRARMSLVEIPDNPAAPEPAKAEAAPELPRQALRHLEEAGRLFEQERYSETVTEAGKALRYNKSIVEAHRLAALASLLLGKTTQAQQYADSAIELRPDDLACRYVRGRLAEKANKPEVALGEYRVALKCPAGRSGAAYLSLTHHYLGLLLYELGYYRAAIEQLRAFETAAAATGDAPTDPELAGILRAKRAAPLLALADSQEALSEYGAAADALSRALQYAPDNKQARIRYIKNLVRAKRFDAAQSEAVRLAETNQDIKSVELLMAVHETAGRRQQGLEALARLREQFPDKTELALFHADRLIAAREYDQAVRVLKETLERHPDATGARWKLIGIHRAQGDDEGWIRAVGAQLTAEPKESERALEELARIPADRASRTIDQEMRRGPAASAPAGADAAAAAGYYYCLGWLAGRLDRLDDAHNLFNRARQARPDLALAPLGMAELWIARCVWDKALAELNEIKTEDATAQAALHRMKGQCYDGLDNLEQARSEYRESLKSAPTPETAVLLGRLLDRFHLAKQAAELYEQTLTTNPEMVEVRELLVMNLLNRWSEGENLKTVLAQVKQMQSTAPEHPATVRTTALVRLLMRQPPDLDGYIRVLSGLVDARPEEHQSRRALAVGLVRKGDYAGGIAHLQNLLQSVPRDSEGNELLAVALMRQLSIDKAADQLVRSLEWYPNREALLRNLAETRLVQQDYDSAIAAWQKLLTLDVNKERHPLYRARLVSTCLQAGRHEKARQLTEQWLKDANKGKELPALRSYLLAADAAEANYDKYLERCREWLGDDAKDEQVQQWLLGVGELPGQAAGGLIGAGRPDQAVAQATAWASTAGAPETARFTLLRTLRAAQRYGDLIELCRADLSVADRPAEKLMPLQLLADAYLRAERHDDAIAAVKEMASQAAQITEADLGFELDEMLVSYLAQAKRYDDAIAQATRVLSGLSEQDARLAELAQNEGGDVARRVQIIQAQEQLRRQRSQVLRSLSFVYNKQERREQVIDCLRQAHKLTPEEAGINNDLGYTLADAGMNLDEAEEMLKAAVSEVLWNGVGEDDQQAAFLDSLGWLYYKQGKFDQARRWLALGVKMQQGDDPVIHDHLGDVEWRLGHPAEAVRMWKRSIELHDKRVTERSSDQDEKLVTSVKGKLEAAAENGKPAVATATSD